MKVSELIEELSKLDPDILVMTPGYEGGLRDVRDASDVELVRLNVNSEWYYGPHERVCDKDKDKKLVKAVIL